MSEEELPEGWTSAPLGELLELGGLFDGPFGSNLKTSDYTAAGVRVIRLENLTNLRFVEEKRTYISKGKYSTLRKHTVIEGDLLFGSFLDDAVRVTMLPALDTPAIAKADCFCIRPQTAVLVPQYLMFHLGATRTKDALLEEIHGATRPRVTTRQLRQLEILIAPLAEQKRIVAKVEELLVRVNAARERLARVSGIIGGARVAPATAQVERLTQAILAKAFRGELVPTEAELARREGRAYEPASTLLERVRTESAGATARGDGRRGRAIAAGAASTRSGARRRA